ncbi:MAG: TetR family transcriptional regulator [Dehalococcoidia bacterium]
MAVKTRREEYAEQTRRAIVDAASVAFVRDGFEGASIDDIASAARVTKGAVYHHFASKADLFLAVFREAEEEMMRVMGERARQVADPWERALASLSAFFDICLEDRFRRIALQEGPLALGWERWRELDEQYALGGLRRTLEQLMERGLLAKRNPDILARVMLAALSEAAIAIAAADDRIEARQQAETAVVAMLSGLRG